MDDFEYDDDAAERAAGEGAEEAAVERYLDGQQRREDELNEREEQAVADHRRRR